MTLPSSGTLSMSQVNVELQRPPNSPLNLNDPIVRALAGVPSGPYWMSALYGKSYEVYATLSGHVTAGRYNLDQLFSESDRRYKKCILNISACKLGGGDRTWGSLHSASGDWNDLTVNIVGGTYIGGSGGNGGAGGGCGPGQARGDGGHGITFIAGSNARVYIEGGSSVGGGGAGGDYGWYVACGYGNSGTGGAGGGGAGFPAGAGGPNGAQNGNCFCYASNAGQAGNEWNGGECGYASGFGNGCETAGQVAAQHGSRGGGLGQQASRLDGCYPFGYHGSPGSAIVNARSVRSDNVTSVFGLIDDYETRIKSNSVETAEQPAPKIIGFIGNHGGEFASTAIYETEEEWQEYVNGSCGDCPTVDVSDLA